MKLRPLATLLALAGAGPALAQSGTGVTWDAFGPDRSSGAFLNITREHLLSENALGIAVDTQQRLLVLNEWGEAGNINTDCAVTRHLSRARLIDMSYTGPEELEATRRIAPDMGGSNADNCSAIDSDGTNRAIVVGSGDYGTEASGFVVRLDADGAYDTSFSSDGKLALKNLAPFANVSSRLLHVQAQSNSRIVTCGWVLRGSNRNFLAMRFTSAGALDTSFNGTGYLEIDFAGAGSANDSCTRVALLPGGDLAFAGTATDANGDLAYAVVRVDANGNYDTGFSGDGRLLIDDGSDLAATPSLADLVYDVSNNRLLLGCTLAFSASLTPSGCVIALRDNGSFDTGFDDDGRKAFRFSSFGVSAPRELGGTRVRRILPRGDGSLFVLGTHENSTADAANFGDSDVASLRVESNGTVLTSGGNVYASAGVGFHTFPEVRQQGVTTTADRRVADVLIDATLYRGNLLLLAERPRYPNNVFDHDNDGNLNEPGPIAPVIASITSDRLFDSDNEFDGLSAATGGLSPVISTPAGFGNYCSVRNASGGGFGLLPQGGGSDPCQVFLDTNPTAIIERSGLYSLSGTNWVLGTCDGNFITLRPGTGTAPFNTAFNDTAGRSNCIFTAVPEVMPIFSRPYTGAHVGNAQAFNHDGYNISLNVADFGQSPGTYNACYVDNRGRQRSIGNPDANPSTCQGDGSGVDEPASDIPVTRTRMAVSVAAGRVVMAVPRHVPTFSPAGNDPYQREVFIRHSVGSGQYAEVFTTYYAHMLDTAVRRGQNVTAGSVLGRVGTTGASSGDHLHISAHRNKNLSWRKTFEFNFVGQQFDRDGSVSAIDPWGWQAPSGVDPWAWRFRNHPSDSTRDDAGSFSTNLWISGEAPTLN